MKYSGIDNAFFLADFFVPAQLSVEKLGVKSFDLTFNRSIYFPKDMKVITLGHRLLDVDSIKYFFKHGFNTYKIEKKYDMISDYPDDFLPIYGNSKITHSDRVHACVATLSFGGQAQYYDTSDRSYLFEWVKLIAIKNSLVKLDQNFIAIEKEKHLQFIKSCLLKLL
jgi:hypothetical protein